MTPKVKFGVAIAAVTGLQCVALAVSPAPTPAGTTTGTTINTTTTCTTTGLCLPALPPMPAVQATRGWERGVSTGLPTSGAQSAYLVMYKDPANLSRFYAFGFDPVGSRNLFVFSVLLTDATNFQSQWAIDVGAWRASRGTSPSQTGTTDGIGTTTPPPRPQLDNLMWEHAFYHSAAQSQIDQSVQTAPAIPR